MSLLLSAGGIAAAFLGSRADARGVAFWIAVVAFVAVAAITIRVFWPVGFAWDFDAYELVNEYVDRIPPAAEDAMMREIAVYAADDYRDNRRRLDRLFTLQSSALQAFGVEVVALLFNLVVE